MEQCTGCGKIKEEDQFHKNGKGGLRAWCKACCSVWQKEHYQESGIKERISEQQKGYYQEPGVRERKDTKVKERKQTNRKLWVDFAAAIGYDECSICGYDKCFKAIEFHHTDPEEKEMNVSNLLRRAFSAGNIFKFLDETDKCIIVCANCHREIHNLDDFDPK